MPPNDTIRPSTDEIIRRLLKGQRSFGPMTIDITTDGLGGRYVAYISTPMINTICRTPLTVHSEGILSFCERLAGVLNELS